MSALPSLAEQMKILRRICMLYSFCQLGTYDCSESVLCILRRQGLSQVGYQLSELLQACINCAIIQVSTVIRTNRKLRMLEFRIWILSGQPMKELLLNMRNWTVLAITAITALVLLLFKQYSEPNAVDALIVVKYPKANLKSTLLTVRGNNCGMSWTKGFQLSQTAKDTFSVTLSCPLNTSIQLKILQNDSNWMLGQNHQFTLSTTSQTIPVFPSFHPSINPILDTPSVSSKLLNNSRICSIYYPPSYYDNPYKQYPLLIMHDGQNLFEDAKSAFGAWKIQDTLNSYIVQGKIKEVIVVGVWNTNNRNNQYTYSYDKTEKFGGKGDLYLDFIQQELMPQVRNWLNGRIASGRFGIGGSSLGGLISCYGAYKRPQVYDRAICMSSSFWWNKEDFLTTVLSAKTDQSLYLDSGDAGTSQDSKNQTIRVRQKLESMGYKINSTLFYYLDQGGQHNEYYWGKRFGIPLSYLYS